MNNKWDHVINQVDNWIWLFLAVAVYVAANVFDVPDMNLLAGACLVKIKGENGNA